MINWIRNRLWNRRRMLFRFHDGKRLRRADPLAIAIAMHEHAEYLPRHLTEAVEGDKDALRIVAKSASDIFGLEPLQGDGSVGLTMQERLEIMLAFDAYLRALKKNTAQSQTSRLSTAPTSTASPAEITSSM